MNSAFTALAVIATVCVVMWTVKSEKGATSFFISALQGVAGLFAVNLAGMVTGVSIAVNWYTVLSYVILGLPGVISTLILNLIMAV